MIHVTIFGAGLIGCYLGGLLAHGGCALTFIGREKQENRLMAHGLNLTHYDREEIWVPAGKFKFQTEAKNLNQTDIILLCVKSQDTGAAAKTIRDQVSSNPLIISCQNGVQNPEILKSTLPQALILGAVVPYNITSCNNISGKNVFHCGTEGGLIVQTHQDPRLGELIAAFARAGESVDTVTDIKAVQWGKLLVNLNNGLNALWGGPLRAGLMQRPYRLALALMIEEAQTLLGQVGIEARHIGKADMKTMLKIMRLPNFLFGPIMNRILKIDQTARSSMLEDLEAGKPSEIEFLQGEVTRLAKQIGQTAPINTVISDRVKAAFKRGQSPKMSGEEIWDIIAKL